MIQWACVVREGNLVSLPRGQCSTHSNEMGRIPSVMTKHHIDGRFIQLQNSAATQRSNPQICMPGMFRLVSDFHHPQQFRYMQRTSVDLQSIAMARGCVVITVNASRKWLFHHNTAAAIIELHHLNLCIHLG